MTVKSFYDAPNVFSLCYKLYHMFIIKTNYTNKQKFEVGNIVMFIS